MIESLNNGFIKETVKLHQKKYRQKTQKFIVEGFHLVEEALKANMLEKVILKSKVEFDYNEKVVVSDKVFNALSKAQSSQGIIGVCHQPEMITSKKDFVLLIDGVQDPGNLGTIIRSADAFGVDLIVLGEGCVDLYNQKVINSSQGSIFHLPIVSDNLKKFINEFDGCVYGTSLEASKPLSEIKFASKLAFIVGNEGSGVSQDLLALTSENIIIEMPGLSESLNVGVATSIVMYQISQARK